MTKMNSFHGAMFRSPNMLRLFHLLCLLQKLGLKSVELVEHDGDAYWLAIASDGKKYGRRLF